MKRVNMSYLSGETVEVEMIETKEEKEKFLTKRNLELEENFVVILRKWNFDNEYQYAGLALGNETIIKKDKLWEDRIAISKLEYDEHLRKAMKGI